MGDQAISARQERLWFCGLAALAILLRVLAFNPYSAHAPDEIIQYLEQAHRIVFGYGVVPWEFREFIRSWLIPLMLVPPMQLGEWLDPGGTLYLILPRAMVAALNFAPVLAAWVIGRRISLQHAIVGMAVVAIWVESVAFSVQTLSESLGVAAFMTAAALLHRQAKMPAIVGAGALLALACLFRFQFGPATALFGALMAGKDWRIWKGLILGGVPVVIAGGLIDLAMGLTPYEWIINNYRFNIAEGKMRAIAGEPQPLRYVLYQIESWQLALLVIPLLLLAGWRRHKALMAAALVNLILHQLIDHKEYRYIWLSMQIFLLLAAFGSVDLLRLVFRRNPDSSWATAVLVSGWALVSFLLALSPVHRDAFRTDNDPARAAAFAIHQPTICGLAVPRRRYWQFGYALLHDDKPLFLLADEGPVTRWNPETAAGGFNALLTYSSDPPPPSPWFRQSCSGQDLPLERTCLYLRLGGCRIDERNRPYLIQEALLDAGM
ncbi:MAG: hypothetical protein M3Q19_06110 [Pseudomonadota bacterium]|nr:hypothetical protein [Pseudomonadota bacterium]